MTQGKRDVWGGGSDGGVHSILFLRHECILQSFMLCQVDCYMNGHNYLFVYFKTATLL